MSLNALSSHELIRRGIAPWTRTRRSGNLESAADSDARPAADENRVTNALNALVGYIPTEVITLYVAALSAETALHSTFQIIDAAKILWFFVGLTPALLLLIYLSKVAATGDALPGPGKWPWWKMCAATIAFFVWALAVPGNPYLKDAAAAISGVGAMLVSTLLSIVTPIFERPAPGV
ncbi:MAG TPA: hypothetical protein VES67_06220 [Vicinamibacterales bacterium]|nr:hypothetical protein [Vicinamibacterales bacterium]